MWRINVNALVDATLSEAIEMLPPFYSARIDYNKLPLLEIGFEDADHGWHYIVTSDITEEEIVRVVTKYCKQYRSEAGLPCD